MTMFLVERTFSVGQDQMAEIGKRSRQLTENEFQEITWHHSHVVVDGDANVKTYCIYEAPDEDVVRRHAEMLGWHRVEGIYEIAEDVTPDDFPVSEAHRGPRASQARAEHPARRRRSASPPRGGARDRSPEWRPAPAGSTAPPAPSPSRGSPHRLRRRSSARHARDRRPRTSDGLARERRRRSRLRPPRETRRSPRGARGGARAATSHRRPRGSTGA